MVSKSDLSEYLLQNLHYKVNYSYYSDLPFIAIIYDENIIPWQKKQRTVGYQTKIEKGDTYTFILSHSFDERDRHHRIQLFQL